MQSSQPYVVTEALKFENNVEIEVQNDTVRFAWRLVINGIDASHWTTHYQGLLEHRGWFVATAYWEGILPVMIPFKVTEIKAVESSSQGKSS